MPTRKKPMSKLKRISGGSGIAAGIAKKMAQKKKPKKVVKKSNAIIGGRKNSPYKPY